MSSVQIKAKIALGVKDKITGEIRFLQPEACFRDLTESLKGKILVCAEKMDKAILEKALALGAVGVVAKEADETDLAGLASDLQSSWSPDNFALLLTGSKLEASLAGKTGTIDVKNKRLVVNN